MLASYRLGVVPSVLNDASLLVECIAIAKVDTIFLALGYNFWRLNLGVEEYVHLEASEEHTI